MSQSKKKLTGSGVDAPQVEHPGTGFVVTLGTLTGDGHLAQPRPLGAVYRDLKRHTDVLGFLGGDGLHPLDDKIRFVHLEVEGIKVELAR